MVNALGLPSSKDVAEMGMGGVTAEDHERWNKMRQDAISSSDAREGNASQFGDEVAQQGIGQGSPAMRSLQARMQAAEHQTFREKDGNPDYEGVTNKPSEREPKASAMPKPRRSAKQNVSEKLASQNSQRFGSEQSQQSQQQAGE